MRPARLDRLLTVADLRRAFLRRMPRIVSDYVEGGAEDEVTLRCNRDAFRDVAFAPRVLVDVARRSQAVRVCGTELSLPVMLAPTGLTSLVHPDGERGAARAATAAGTTAVISSASTYSIEELAQGSPGSLWFQLYPWRDRELAGSLLARAAAAGYAALCVTLDVPISGARERDTRNGFRVPLRIRPARALDVARHPVWLGRLAFGRRITLANLTGLDGAKDAATLSQYMNAHLVNPANDWAELRWIRDQWSGPLLVKGVLSAADARLAVDAGVDGIIVSNHGGRQLDGAPASLHALRAVVDAVGADADVLLDSGVRRGSDVVKALALGAKACLIGRPYLYGLGCGGTAGVQRTLQILRTETDRTLALLGCADIRDLSPEYLREP